MKKIISIFVVAMMLVTMSLTAFAADTGVTVAAKAVEVETGTASATINMEISFAEAGNLAMLSWNFVVPEGIELESIDFAELSAKAGKFADESDGDFVMVYDDDDDMQMDFAAEDSVNIAMTFTIADPSVEAEYEISFDEAIVEDIDGNALVEEIAPVTITVKAAAPATKTDVITETITVGDKEIEGFTNYAIYDYTFKTPDNVISVDSYGITVNDEATDFAFDGAITGDTHVVLAIIGIAAEEVADAAVEAYYNVTVNAQ